MCNALYPCTPWPIDPKCCVDWPDDPQEWTDHHRQAQMLATIDLWRAIGGIIGQCRTVERPCMDRCGSYEISRTQWVTPYIRGGNWYNNDACGCVGECSCTRLCTVTLQGPVCGIVEVRVGGSVLDPSSWRLLTGDRVARIDGQCWPSCQDVTRHDHDGFIVTYIRGSAPGIDAIRAVSTLACKHLRDCPGGDACGTLPSGVTTINREGIQMRLDGDGLDMGVASVNSWVASLNPYHLTEVPSVWSPDIPSPLVYHEGPVIPGEPVYTWQS